MVAALPASAVTINEGSFTGGDFGDSYKAVTLIGNGYDTITATMEGTKKNNNDLFAFTSLAPGAQTITFSFAAPAGVGYSFASGGSIYYSTQPFRWDWDGTFAGSFSLGYHNQTGTVSIPLASNFSGAIYLAVYGWGSSIGYTVSAPGNAPVNPVPLPAPAFLLAGAVAGLAALGRRRARRAAA